MICPDANIVEHRSYGVFLPVVRVVIYEQAIQVYPVDMVFVTWQVFSNGGLERGEDVFDCMI